jgi:hypothetical protein
MSDYFFVTPDHYGLAALACGGIALAMPFYFVIRY